MNPIKVLQAAAMLLAACSTEQENAPLTADARTVNFFADGQSKTMRTPRGNYFTLIPEADSTFKLSWGSTSTNRVYNKPFDLLFAERISLEWESQEYLILHYWTGSNSWAEIILPLNATQQVREVQNGRYFDGKQNLLVFEGFSGDTIFQVLNLTTNHQQPIIEQGRLCDALTQSWCADTVYINSNSLCYTFSKQNGQDRLTSVVRRQHLTIE
jgi:hypothetical protein